MFGQKLEKKQLLNEGIPLMLNNSMPSDSQVTFRFKLKQNVLKNMVYSILVIKI